MTLFTANIDSVLLVFHIQIKKRNRYAEESNLFIPQSLKALVD